MIAIVGLAVVAVVSVIGFALFATPPGTAGSYSCAELLVPQQGADPENPMVTANQGNAHVAVGSRLSYVNCPPASGPHYNAAGVAPARPAFYQGDAAIGPGSWLHNLEHGHIVALYRCAEGICPPEETLQAMRSFVAQGPSTAVGPRCGFNTTVLVARFDDMSTPFALLAWDRVLLLESFELPAALDFANRWIDLGPEKNVC